MAFYFDNAISWAVHRLRGGWKNLLIVTAWYTIAAILFLAIPYELAEQRREKMYVLEIASTMVLIFQIVMLLLLSGMSAASAIRRDVASRLIESHRLMPLAPTQAIIGYLVGGSLQTLSIAAVNVILGSVIYAARGIPVQSWLVSNALLFAFSVSLWTAMAMGAFVSRAIFGWLFGLLVSIMCSGGFIFLVLPGLLTFCSPMQGRTILDNSSLPIITSGTVVAVIAQALVALLCIRGAARKYADASALSLTMGPSLAALGIWAALTWFGIANFQQLRPRPLGLSQFDWRLPVIGGIASCLLVALLPLAAMAWSDIFRQQRRMDGDNLPRRPWILPLCISICLLFVLTPLTATVNSVFIFPSPNYYYPQRGMTYPTTRRSQILRAGPNMLPAPMLSPPIITHSTHRAANPDMIAAVCAIFLLDIYLLMRLLYPVVRRANGLIFLLIGISWFAPLFADVVSYGLKDKQPVMDHFALFSPFGTMIQALENPVAGTWLGVCVQGAACFFLTVLFLFVESTRAARRPRPLGLTPTL